METECLDFSLRPLIGFSWFRREDCSVFCLYDIPHYLRSSQGEFAICCVPRRGYAHMLICMASSTYASAFDFVFCFAQSEVSRPT